MGKEGRFLKKAPQKLLHMGLCGFRVNFTPTNVCWNKINKGLLTYEYDAVLYSFRPCALHFVAGLEIYYIMATLYVYSNTVGDDVLGVPFDVKVTFCPLRRLRRHLSQSERHCIAVMLAQKFHGSPSGRAPAKAGEREKREDNILPYDVAVLFAQKTAPLCKGSSHRRWVRDCSVLMYHFLV